MSFITKARIHEFKAIVDRKDLEIQGLLGKIENIEENFNIQYEEIRKKLLKAEREISDTKRHLDSKNAELRDFRTKFEKIEMNLNMQIDEKLGKNLI